MEQICLTRGQQMRPAPENARLFRVQQTPIMQLQPTSCGVACLIPSCFATRLQKALQFTLMVPLEMNKESLTPEMHREVLEAFAGE